MKSILYSDHIIIDKQKDFNKMIYIEPKISKKNIKYILLKFKYDTTIIEASIDKMTLLPLIFSVLDPNHDNLNLWAKIQHHINELSDHPDIDVYLNTLGKVTLLDGFIYGFVSYISFFYFIEKYEFKSLLPINFQLPANLNDGDCTDYHVMQYMYQPLSAMMEIFDEDYFLHSYFKIIIGFINIWSCVFHSGPGINENIINQLNTNVMTGVTKYYLHQLKNVKKCSSVYVDSTSYVSSESDVYNNKLNKKSVKNDNDKMTESYESTESYQSDKIYYNDKMTVSNDILYYNPKTNESYESSESDKIYYNDKKNESTESYESDKMSVSNDKIYYNLPDNKLSFSTHNVCHLNKIKQIDLTVYDSNSLTFSKNETINYKNENLEELIEKKVNKKINKIIDNLDNIITNQHDKSLDDKITRMINDKFNLYLNERMVNIINENNNNNIYNLNNYENPVLNLTTGLKY
jgi:hypothetical protein